MCYLVSFELCVFPLMLSSQYHLSNNAIWLPWVLYMQLDRNHDSLFTLIYIYFYSFRIASTPVQTISIKAPINFNSSILSFRNLCVLFKTWLCTSTSDWQPPAHAVVAILVPVYEDKMTTLYITQISVS